MNAHPHRRSLLVILAVVMALVVAACGGGNETGAGLDLEDGISAEDIAGGIRDTTTTEAGGLEVEGDGGGGAAVTTPPPTNAPTTAPPTTAPAPRFQWKIIEPTPFFDPDNHAVQRGTIIEFVNADKVDREVWINDGKEWRSGLIPPGGKAEYVANKPGDYSLSDNTRPYGVGVVMRVG